jgi:hypothetical protein
MLLKLTGGNMLATRADGNDAVWTTDSRIFPAGSFSREYVDSGIAHHPLFFALEWKLLRQAKFFLQLVAGEWIAEFAIPIFGKMQDFH